MREIVCAMGLLAFSPGTVFSQPQTKEDAFDNLHACYELAAILPLAPDREAKLLGQCSKAEKRECETTRKVLKDSGKADAVLNCTGR